MVELAESPVNKEPTPQGIDATIGYLLTIPSYKPIFYRKDPTLLTLLGSSRSALTEIFKTARAADIISHPHRMMTESGERGLAYNCADLISALEFYNYNGVKQANNLMTLSEAARSIGTSNSLLKKWVSNGEVTFGNAEIDNTVQEISRIGTIIRRIIEPKTLEDPRKYSLKTLTLGRFRRHREAFLTVSDVLKKAGLFVTVREVGDISTTLTKQGIFVTFIPSLPNSLVGGPGYHILSEAYQDIAIGILKDIYESRSKGPVSQVCGPECNPPTVYAIKKKKFESVVRFMRKKGLIVRNADAALRFLGQNCPIPIFKYEAYNLFVYASDQEEVLAKYIELKKNQTT